MVWPRPVPTLSSHHCVRYTEIVSHGVRPEYGLDENATLVDNHEFTLLDQYVVDRYSQNRSDTPID